MSPGAKGRDTPDEETGHHKIIRLARFKFEILLPFGGKLTAGVL